MDVGNSGGTEFVWVTYTKFIGGTVAGAGYIYAPRCNLALSSCSAPAQVSDSADTTSTGSKFCQFSYVTIGPDGRVYVTYATFTVDSFGLVHFGSIKMKIAAAGSTTFGASTVVASPTTTGIPFGAFLHADDFRIATSPKNTVAMVGATPRIFVTDEECTALIGNICEEPQIKVRYSDNSGASWTTLTFGTTSRDNYFPTISTDGSATPNKMALSWYSSANDSTHHRYDVYLASFPSDLSTTAVITRVTSSANEPDADPTLGGTFIGDYFEVFGASGNAYLNFNQSTRAQKWQGVGLSVKQQDNFLAIATL